MVIDHVRGMGKSLKANFERKVPKNLISKSKVITEMVLREQDVHRKGHFLGFTIMHR